MASAESLRKLMQNLRVTLRSKECRAIRFRMENIGIQTFMYSYIVDAIGNGRISLTIGNGDHYDDTTTPHSFTFNSDDPPARTIVHEATHAVIDATHKGQKMARGTNEAAAFLAESVYGLYTGESMAGQFPGHFARTLNRLAEDVHKFNVANHSGLYVCPSSDVMYLTTLIHNLPFSYGNSNQVETMKGIGDGA